jgi:hypothetical protein
MRSLSRGSPRLAHSLSRNIAQQLRLQDELALLVLLALLERLVVLPPHRLVALPARNIPHDVSPGRHVSLRSFAGRHVDDRVE